MSARDALGARNCSTCAHSTLHDIGHGCQTYDCALLDSADPGAPVREWFATAPVSSTGDFEPCGPCPSWADAAGS